MRVRTGFVVTTDIALQLFASYFEVPTAQHSGNHPALHFAGPELGRAQPANVSSSTLVDLMRALEDCRTVEVTSVVRLPSRLLNRQQQYFLLAHDHGFPSCHHERLAWPCLAP